MTKAFIGAAGLWLLGVSTIAAAPTFPVPSPELLFEPIAPCRAFNTHATTALAGPGRSFIVSGTTGFEAQGGTPGGCGVPPSAGAVALSLVTSGASKAGALMAYPNGSPPTGAVTALSFTPSLPGSSSVSVGVGAQRIVLKTDTPVHVSGDITGYYAPQIQGSVYSDSMSYAATRRVTSFSHPSTGVYAFQIDRDVTYCSALVGTPTKETTATAEVSGLTVTVKTFAKSICAPSCRFGVPLRRLLLKAPAVRAESTEVSSTSCRGSRSWIAVSATHAGLMQRCELCSARRVEVDAKSTERARNF